MTDSNPHIIEIIIERSQRGLLACARGPPIPPTRQRPASVLSADRSMSMVLPAVEDTEPTSLQAMMALSYPHMEITPCSEW